MTKPILKTSIVCSCGEDYKLEGSDYCRSCRKKNVPMIHYPTWSKEGKKVYLCNSKNYKESLTSDDRKQITCKNCRHILLIDK